MDFPPPLTPTSASILEAGMVRFRLYKMMASGRDGYVNSTSLNSICPLTVDNMRPPLSYASISGTRSMISKTRPAATVPCANWA